MFTFNPELANEAGMYDDDDVGVDTVSYHQENGDDNNDGDSDDGDQNNVIVTNDLSNINYYTDYFKIDDEEDAVVPDVSKLKIASASGGNEGSGSSTKPGPSNTTLNPGDSVPIDEDLFNDDELFDDDEEIDDDDDDDEEVD